MGLSLTLFVLVPDNGAGRWFTLAAVIVSGLLVWRLVRARVSRIPNSVLLLVGFYFIITLGTLGQDNAGELLGLLQRAIPVILLALSATRFDQHDKDVLVVWLVVVGTAEAVLGLLQQFFRVLPTWGWLADPFVYRTVTNEITGGVGRVPGTMSHGIPLGLLIGTAVVLVLSGRAMRSWPVRIGLSLILVCGLAQTGSRSSIIVLALTVALMAIILVRNWFLKLLLFAVMVGSLFVINFGGLTLITSLQGTDSLTHRVSSGNTLLQLVGLGPWNALFGNGWAFTDIVTAAGVGSARIQAIDNGFVSTVALAGFLGLSFFLVIVVRGLRWNDGSARMVIILTLGMYMSFDVELWTASFAPLVVFCYQTAADNPLPRLDSASQRRSSQRRCEEHNAVGERTPRSAHG